MDTQTFFTLVGAVLGFLAALVVAFVVMPKVDSECPLPMPPFTNYLLGHAADLLDVRHFVRTQMRWFHQLGDVFQIWLVHRRVVVIAHPDDVFAALRYTNIFSRPAAQTTLFEELQSDNFQTMSRAVHSAQRRRIRKALSENTVQEFSDIVSRAANALVGRLRLQHNDAVNTTPLLADTTFRVLLEAVLGAGPSTLSERDAFAKESRNFLTELFIEISTYPLRRLTRLFGTRRNLFRRHRAVKKFTGTLVDRRANETAEEQANRPYDMMDVILELDPDNRERQVSNATMFAIAGFESSSEALAWALYEITGRPEVGTRIQAEVDAVLGERTHASFKDVEKMFYVQNVWKETLRLHPAAGFVLRETTKTVDLPGTNITIPQGVQVGVLIYAAQRHPRFVPDGDAFRPERWAESRTPVPVGSFVPFSCGPERCPGRALAEFEGVAIIAALYRNFNISMACDRNLVQGISDWTERVRAPAPGSGAGDLSWSLPLKFIRRKNNKQ